MDKKIISNEVITKLIQKLNLDYFLVLDELFEKVFCNDSIDDEIYNEISLLGIEYIENNVEFILKDGLRITHNVIEIDGATYYLFRSVDKDFSEFISGLNSKCTLKIFNNIEKGVTVLKNKKVIFRNSKAKSILAINDINSEVYPVERYLDEDSIKRLNDAFLEGNNDSFLMNLTNENGERRIVNTAVHMFDYGDDIFHVISISDVTLETELNNRLKYEKEYLTQTLKSIKQGIIICDNENRITLFNEFASDISGYSEKEAMDCDINDIIRVINSDNRLIDLSDSVEFKNDNLTIISKNDLYRYVSINSSNIYDDSMDILGKVIVIIDMSEIRKRESEILYLSYHDVLTGIYNRTFLEFELKRLDTKRQMPFAIIMGDVNGLKVTNDVFGHRAGDLLLKKVAEVLKSSCRHEDIIGRWGGDEFIILLPNTTEEETFVLMKRIIRDFEALSISDSINGLIPSMSLGYGIKLDVEENIYSVLKVAENNMYKRKMLSAESIYSSIITSMKTALFEKSTETEEHTNRLYKYCKQIGDRYNLSSDEFNDLELLCMLHDIGKIGISDAILQKPSSLNDEEWIEMKTHPDIGFRIAQATPELKKVANYILYHHEKFDGTGYPIGLKAYDIPLIDRILSVVDAFDAMTNNRTYRQAMSIEMALKEIVANSGTQFDPEVVKIFTEILK